MRTALSRRASEYERRVKEHCGKCDYYRGNSADARTCDYLLLTGRPRVVPVLKCDKYKERRRRRP